MSDKINLRKKPIGSAESSSAVRADAELEALRRELETAKSSSSASRSSTSRSSSNSKSVADSTDAELARLRKEIEDMKVSKSRSAADSVSALRRDVDRSSESKTSSSREIEELKKALRDLDGGSKGSATKDDEIRRLEAELKAASRESASRASSRSTLDRELTSKASLLADKLNGVDVCFLMDCTGSMGAWIAQTKDKVEEIARLILEKNKGWIKIRMAFVGYRDHCDSDRFSIFPFSESASDLSRFLTRVDATGGGDGPEDIAGGLMQAKELDWFSSARVVIHFADAPCHGSRYHSYSDDYPSGDPDGLVPEKLLQQMRTMQIDYYFVRINNSTDDMIRQFKSSGCQVNQLELAANSIEFVPKVVMSVTASISASRARAKDILA